MATTHTGDTLITACVQAASDDEALAIAATVPALVIMEAADLLYLGDDAHGIRWYRRMVASAARA